MIRAVVVAGLLLGVVLGGDRCRERPPWRSATHWNATEGVPYRAATHRNATEGVPYRAATHRNATEGVPYRAAMHWNATEGVPYRAATHRNATEGVPYRAATHWNATEGVPYRAAMHWNATEGVPYRAATHWNATEGVPYRAATHWNATEGVPYRAATHRNATEGVPYRAATHWNATEGVPYRAPEESHLGISLPEGKATFDLRFDCKIAGKSAEQVWEAFLDRVFDYFDRDGDGSLSRAEVGRMFTLPLPDRRELVVDFAGLDTNSDGKASRAELKAYCQRKGFTPVVLILLPPTAEDQRLGETLAKALAADGKVTRETLKKATDLLDRFDANDDEALDAAEILGADAPARPAAIRMKRAKGGVGDAVLRLDLGADGAPRIDGARAKGLRLSGDAHPTLREPAGRWQVTLHKARTLPDMKAANDFLVAQFETALAGQAALARKDVEDDATLTGLLDLFAFADRNGDGRLTLTELKAYLELVSLGVRSQTWITARERGQSLFHFLDADGDGRLSYAELARADKRLADFPSWGGTIPWQVEVNFGGPAVSTWGGVPIPAMKKRAVVAKAARRGPKWFQAMDRNGDGVVSPREFVGAPEVFRKLDTDGDGVLTAEEAERAP